MLLILISIWIYKKFKSLALSKGYDRSMKKWGWTGVGVYIGSSLVFMVFVGVLMGFGLFTIDLESTGVNLIFNLVSFAIGGIVTMIVYNMYDEKEDKRPDVSSFGRDDNGLPTFDDDLDE